MITISVDDHPSAAAYMNKLLKRIDPDGTHLTAANMDEAQTLITDETQIAFLDIEMPGMGGIEAADMLQKQYRRLNIVFVTGHPEYGYQAHDVFPSAFLTKPISEADIRRALEHLRIPLDTPAVKMRVQCSPFSMSANGKPFEFSRKHTSELFAYLVYRNGAFCSNDELIDLLWDGERDKQSNLRQLVMDMRVGLAKIGAENILLKKYGKTAVDPGEILIEGNAGDIPECFGWHIL